MDVKKYINQVKKGRVLLVLTDIHTKIITGNHAYLAHIKIIRTKLQS
jgi:hypothetical protein